MAHRSALLFFFAGYVSLAYGYSSGGVTPACDTMLPQHGGNQPQQSTPPYSITVSATSFRPGDTITVTVKTNGAPGIYFKGFLLEARLAGGNTRAGTLTTTDGNAQVLACGTSTAISHRSSSMKQSVTAKWTAPEGAGTVFFIATVLQAYNTFWTGIKSENILALQISNSGCGTQKFCLSDPANCNPSDSNCLFMSSAPSSDGTGYVLEMSGSTSGYVAIGYSDDEIMGSDDVYICTKNSSGAVVVQHGYTTGRVPPTISGSNNAGSIVTSYVNGVLQCSFVTQSAISTQQPQRAASGSSYYIFLAKGPSQSSGQIMKHDTKLISSTKVDLSSFLSTTTQGGRGQSDSVRAHGALMLIAWMATGSIGMFMARYMKSSAGRPFLGKALWYQTHFFLMILTVVLTSIAFIIIFAKVAGWSYYMGAHPILGCIVMILSFIQPIGALFRPDPKSEKRFIFNWAHCINALVIKILAVATIFLGLVYIDTSSNQWMAKVMAGYFAWEVLFYIILEVNMLLKTKDIYEITDDKVQIDSTFLLVFVFGNLAFLIALLVGIGQS